MAQDDEQDHVVGEPAPEGGTSRRQLLTRVAAGTALAWAAPQVLTMQPAFAQGSDQPGGVPGAPVIGEATSGVAGGAVTAQARWRAGTDGSSPTTGYRVTATRSDGAETESAVQPPLAGQDRDQTLTMTLPTVGDYRFTVVAINAAGTSPPSQPSNVVRGQ